jgi:hypothetical protein
LCVSHIFYLISMKKNVCSIKQVKPLKGRGIPRIKVFCTPKRTNNHELRDLVPHLPLECSQFTNDHSLQATVQESVEINLNPLFLHFLYNSSEECWNTERGG